MDYNDTLQSAFKKFDSLVNSYWPYIIGFVLGILSAIRKYMGGPPCPNNERIDDAIVLITGASSGIGKATALELARRGGHIILAVRDEEAGNKVANEISSFGGKAEVRKIDLSSLKSVRDFAKSLEVNEIDILINNAGIVFHPFEKTSEGFEMHFVTNYLGHFLLTLLLLPKLKASKQGRIINISSQAHTTSRIHLENLNLEETFTAREAFGQSKLALILMAEYMGSLLWGTNVTINVVDPGIVRGTQHMRHSPINSMRVIKFIMQPWMWLLLKSPMQAAQTIVYASTAKELVSCSGKYFSDCEIKLPSNDCVNSILGEKLYIKSHMLVKPYI